MFLISNQKCYNYRTFKKGLDIEQSLLKLPVLLRISSTHVRLGMHKLPVEMGRQEGVEKYERRCNASDELGGEFHYLIVVFKV